MRSSACKHMLRRKTFLLEAVQVLGTAFTDQLQPLLTVLTSDMGCIGIRVWISVVAHAVVLTQQLTC